MSASVGEPGFRRMRTSDLPLLHEWLQRPHVRRWWAGQTYGELVAEYLPSIEGRDPTRLFVIQLDGRDVGFIQTWLAVDEPGCAAAMRVGAGVAGVDLLIGEPDLIGKGLGPELLRRFVAEIVFASGSTTACVADPEAANAASIRAFEKAGFRRVHGFACPKEGTEHVLMRLERADAPVPSR